jgi:trigger factor
MSVKLEKAGTNVVKLEITVEADKFNEALKKAYAKNAKKFNIPGFRKGKAPMSVIKKFYGEGVFFEDAVNICIEETYPAALDEHKVNPVDYPQIDVVDMGEGKELVYTATVAVVPEVKLGEYKGVEVKSVEYPVNDETVLAEIEEVQSKNARIEVKAEGTVEMGDIAVIDFKGFVDGVAFEGGEGTDYSLEIGSGSFIDTFEDQLVGLAKDEKKNVSVTFPENYGKEELNGKPAVFEVTVKEIKVKELPALDDEFAKEVSEFDTLDAYKADIKSKLEVTNEAKAKREFEEAVIDAVCANVEVEIPEAMINREIDNMLRDLEMRLKYQGLDLNTYYQYTNSSEAQMKDYMKENAEKKVKTELVIAEVAKAEEIVATEEEIKERATEVAKQYGGEDLEKTVDLLLQAQGEYLKQDVINEKVIKLLVENSKAIA